MVSEGRVERAMAPFGRKQVEGRRSGLFGQRLWGGLSMVVAVAWRLEWKIETGC